MASKYVTKLLTFAFILILLFGLAAKIHLIGSGLGGAAWKMREIINVYIRNNNGRFPSSESDLEKTGLLKKTEHNNGIRYYIRYGATNEDRWHEFNYFDMFRIYYGVNTENLKVLDGIIYDKSTNKPLLLIEGLYKWALRKVYQSISLEWYELMLQEKQRAKNTEETTKGTE